jgi:uncharacterized protein (DUF1786 family)
MKMGNKVRTVEEKRKLYVDLTKLNIETQEMRIKEFKQFIANYSTDISKRAIYSIQGYCEEILDCYARIEKEKELLKIFEQLKEEE